MTYAWSATSKAQDSDQQEFQRALDLFTHENYRASGKILNNLIGHHRDNPLYWFNLGNVYFSLADYAQAVRAYSVVVQAEKVGRTQLGPLARLYLAKTYRKMGDRASAKQLIVALQTETLPPNITKDVNDESLLLSEASELSESPVLLEAMELYKDHRYQAALKEFELGLGEKLTAEAAMMIGLANLKLGDPHQAVLAFHRVLALNPSSELNEMANDFIHQIQADLWPRKYPYWLWLDVAGGYNSNYFENGASESAIAEPGTQLGLGAGYRFLKEEPWYLNLGYQFSWLEVSNQPQARLMTHNVDLPLSYQTKTWLIQIDPTYVYQTLQSSPFLTKAGGNATVHRYFGELGAGIRYDYFHNKSNQTFYDYLTGDVQSLKLYFDYNAGDFYASLFYVAISENTGDMPYSNGVLPLADKINGIGLTASYFIGSWWQISGSAIEYFKTFDHVEEPDQTVRRDSQTYASLRLNYFSSPTLIWYFNQEATINHSTLGSGSVTDKNFNKSVTFLGVNWSFFQ
ncbi:MAG: hypothetical protein C5B49_07955 [Bdellovibrio sp.]|nr:MAG: hypothetical protein C5B49_07955 [Bdellovibrio sp.]